MRDQCILRDCLQKALKLSPAESYLIRKSGYKSCTFRVRGELMDMLDKPFDNFYVALSECCHKNGHLSVVLTINICTITKEQLAYFQMAPLKINIAISINNDLKEHGLLMFLYTQ